MTVDWEQFQKCPVCDAPLGEPCATSLAVVAGQERELVERDRPHSTRKLRAAAARAGGDRG